MKLNGGGTDQSGTSCVDHICEMEAANRIVDNAIQYGFIWAFSIFPLLLSLICLSKNMSERIIRLSFIDIFKLSTIYNKIKCYPSPVKRYKYYLHN